ncbi:MAG: hypothetical protein E6Q44_10325 [Flavobacteriales bacterium]|jgi:hypothetical protein|nr:MAG: hypothetical protein E6Q44_10325 [Flavobacteriales bacterium]
MNNTIKTILIGIIAALAIALVGKSLLSPDGPIPAGSDQPSTTSTDGPLVGSGLRFDGHYRYTVGNLIYLLRFFPEGRVVTVNGTQEVEKDLPAYLVRETRGNPGLGLHNVPVDLVGDSLVFITHPEKGEIEYRGVVVSGSMVRFLRHSHITGTRQLMEYVFQPDGTSPSQEDTAQVVQPL